MNIIRVYVYKRTMENISKSMHIYTFYNDLIVYFVPFLSPVRRSRLVNKTHSSSITLILIHSVASFIQMRRRVLNWTAI